MGWRGWKGKGEGEGGEGRGIERRKKGLRARIAGERNWRETSVEQGAGTGQEQRKIDVYEEEGKVRTHGSAKDISSQCEEDHEGRLLGSSFWFP